MRLAKRSLCLLLVCLLPMTGCSSVMKVHYRDIPEKEIGELSYVAVDEKTSKQIGGVIVKLYRAGEKKPFRKFISDSRGPVRLTDLEPGHYLLKANKLIDEGGDKRNITGDTEAKVQIAAGRCQRFTQVMKDNGDKIIAGLVIGSVVLLAVAVLVAAASRDARIFGVFLAPIPRGGRLPGDLNLWSEKVQAHFHITYEYDSAFYANTDLEVDAPPPGKGLIQLPPLEGKHKPERISPDLPLLVILDMSTVDDEQVTVWGRAKSARGMREVRFGGLTAYRIPPERDEDGPVHEISFLHTHEGLEVSTNFLHIKAVDRAGFCAETVLRVERPGEAPEEDAEEAD